jgi:hypothetical protein
MFDEEMQSFNALCQHYLCWCDIISPLAWSKNQIEHSVVFHAFPSAMNPKEDGSVEEPTTGEPDASTLTQR